MDTELGDDIRIHDTMKQTLGVFTQFNKTQPDYFDAFTNNDSNTNNTPLLYQNKYFEHKLTEKRIPEEKQTMTIF